MVFSGSLRANLCSIRRWAARVNRREARRRMRVFLVLQMLACVVTAADTGYVYTADLNGDGIEDSIRSGPSWLFGNGGGPFIVSISDGTAGFILREIEMHPMAASLDLVDGKPRIWTYWRTSCCDGTLSVTTLDKAFETSSVRLNFSEDSSSQSISREIYNGVFSNENRIDFTTIENYDPPPPLRGEWGK